MGRLLGNTFTTDVLAGGGIGSPGDVHTGIAAGDAMDLDDYEQQARSALDGEVYDYYAGGPAPRSRWGPTGEHGRTTTSSPASAGETELGRVHGLAAREDEPDDGLHDDLARVMDDLEPPADVAEIVVPMDRASASHGTGPDGDMLVRVARVMVVVPESGEPFCAVVGLGSDGKAAGTLADGEVDDDCRDAQIPVQSQNAFAGNPLASWDQDARWLDPRDQPPS